MRVRDSVYKCECALSVRAFVLHETNASPYANVHVLFPPNHMPIFPHRIKTGAGSVMEALDLGKALLVVVNTGLMDDHQQELARAMEEQVRRRWENEGVWIEKACMSVSERKAKSQIQTESSSPTNQEFSRSHPHLHVSSSSKGYLVATEPPHVLKSLQSYHQWHGRLKPRPPPTLGLLPALLNQEMGFLPQKKGEANEREESSRRQGGRLRGSGGGNEGK